MKETSLFCLARRDFPGLKGQDLSPSDCGRDVDLILFHIVPNSLIRFLMQFVPSFHLQAPVSLCSPTATITDLLIYPFPCPLHAVPFSGLCVELPKEVFQSSLFGCFTSVMVAEFWEAQQTKL